MLSGYAKQVRYLALAKGKKNSNFQTLLYYELLVDLTFNSKQYQWSDGTPLMEYTLKIERSLF
jgi:hypothetical protein